jgi:hypothetical protein
VQTPRFGLLNRLEAFELEKDHDLKFFGYGEVDC